jgi:hypothetical protein
VAQALATECVALAPVDAAAGSLARLRLDEAHRIVTGPAFRAGEQGARLMSYACGVVLSAMVVWLMAAAPADARIRCDGNYQIINGQPHATPYCQDEHLAQVARSYGLSVSGSAMRNSPSEKQRVCQFLGSDIRVREACQGYGPDGRSGPILRF